MIKMRTTPTVTVEREDSTFKATATAGGGSSIDSNSWQKTLHLQPALSRTATVALILDLVRRVLLLKVA